MDYTQFVKVSKISHMYEYISSKGDLNFFSIPLRKYNIFFSFKYAVYASIISLDRGKLYDKVVKGSEIAEVLHDCPDVQRYLTAFYNCHYGNFFQCLAEVEQVAKNDRYMHPHYAYYVREMKIKVFAQLLESYRR